MIVESKGFEGGFIADKYGKRGQDFAGDVPSLSFPFIIKDAPEKTVSYAVILDDPDSVPVAGFIWIHWLIANLQQSKVVENASRNNPDFIQGQNSWQQNFYGGMTPPNASHCYRLRVFALDDELPLKEGFSEKALLDAMNGHILATAELRGWYRN